MRAAALIDLLQAAGAERNCDRTIWASLALHQAAETAARGRAQELAFVAALRARMSAEPRWRDHLAEFASPVREHVAAVAVEYEIRFGLGPEQAEWIAYSIAGSNDGSWGRHRP